uniref:Uncharacterized protein n=1 Tax=Arundo donax TaxID=35708 RepID=A0A0A9KY51_ARUDO
MNRQKLASLLV